MIKKIWAPFVMAGLLMLIGGFGYWELAMKTLALVVVASMIGAKAMGMEVLLAINRIEVGRGFEAGLSIVFLAIIMDRLTNAMAAKQKQDEHRQRPRRCAGESGVRFAIRPNKYPGPGRGG